MTLRWLSIRARCARFVWLKENSNKKAEITMNIRDEWGTPRALFEVIDAEFDFDMDVCATDENAKCERYRSWPSQDGLKSGWGQRNWCNPPYSNIGPWLAIGKQLAGFHKRLSVFLLPVDVSTRWWTESVCEASEIRFLVGKRVQFEAPKGVKPSSNTGSSCLVIYRPGAPAGLSTGPHVTWWNWSSAMTPAGAPPAVGEG